MAVRTCSRLAMGIFFVILFSSFLYQEKITWIAIGDSITYLNEHADETGGRVSKGYMTRVVDKLPEISYVNQGHNGWTARGIADKIDSLGLESADIYTILLGTNDWWQGLPIGTLQDYRSASGSSTIYGSFRIIIDKLRKLNPSAKIVLMTPMKRTDFVYMGNFHNKAYGSYQLKNGQWLQDVAKAIIDIGKHEKLPVVDLFNNKQFSYKRLVKFKRLKDSTTNSYRNFTYPEYTKIPFNPDDTEYPYPEESIDLTYDGLHPSDVGNEIIANELVKCFRKIGLLRNR